ncbi:hypothetical protein [Amphritea sp. HPY]|uniref:hypothetical protein n=1 Tax=Amphritea sp. HPY TaxID=3421652 RepID=UPI003D7DA44D
MTESRSSSRQRWLDLFVIIQALQSEIYAVLRDDSEDATERLNQLIPKQDSAIRQLPFSELSAADVTELQPKIELLQHNHKQLTEVVTNKRQGLLLQSSQSKKAGRSINAYRQTQDI